MTLNMKITTTFIDDSLLLYPELTDAQIRSVQRRLKAGALRLVAKGFASALPESEWPGLVARNRIRVLAAFFPDTVMAARTAFDGGSPCQNTVHLSGTYRRTAQFPGLEVQVWRGAPPQAGDQPMMGRPLYFPSEERLLLENLSPSRGPNPRTAGSAQVETRLLAICASRGEGPLAALRERARALAPVLGLDQECIVLDGLVGSILISRPSVLKTRQGMALAAGVPYDTGRLALFESLAAHLRSNPLPMPFAVATTAQAKRNFAFLESYFSNFIEGTEFDVQEARGFVLDGKPIEHRPKDSHDIIGVFEQALSPTWSTLTMASGEPALEQLRARHRHQMERRPEVNPGEFKLKVNRAGNTEFAHPDMVRGTLMEGSKLLASVPTGTARAMLAMFLISEVHPFDDGNGRLARLVMNAELSAANGCRIIVPTLFREQYLDCFRVLTREGDPVPFLKAMQYIHDWTSRFDYQDLDEVIDKLAKCHAFERSLVQFKLLLPVQGNADQMPLVR